MQVTKTEDGNLVDQILLGLDENIRLQIIVLGNCDPRVFIEYIVVKEEKKLFLMKTGTAKNNVIVHEVNSDLLYCLRDRLVEVSQWSEFQRFPNSSNPYDNSDRVTALIEKHKNDKCDDLCDEDETMPDIDLAVTVGGNTRLHVAVMDDDMEEVIHLVDKLKAKTGIKNNSGWTPYDLSVHRRDRKEIAEYLSHHLH